MNDFSNIFKDLRKHLGLTQSEFSNQLGVSRGVVAQIETGNNQPTTDLILKIIGNVPFNN